MLTRNRQKSHAGSSTIGTLNKINQRHSPEKCRVCLDDGEIPIFGVNDISEDVVEFGKIEVGKDDGLPQYLCEACYTLLEAAILFRKTATEADKVLRKVDYVESGSEDSDNNKNESEPFIKREYLELNYSSDSEVNDFDINKNEQEDTSNHNLIICDSDDLGEGNEDFKPNIVKEEKEDEITKLAENEIAMMFVSNKDNQRIAKPGCAKCYLVFDTVQELTQHMEKAHPKLLPTQRNCEICFKIVSKSTYKEHIQEHREKYKKRIESKYGKVKCEFCGKKVSKAYIKQHLKMHGTPEEQAERFIECPICSKKLSAQYFNDHIRRMHDKKSPKNKLTPQNKCEETTQKSKFNKCPVCDKKIKESQYALHLAKHGGQLKQYICDKCGKVLKHQSAFKTHSLTHGSELKYKCQFCPYRGLHQGLLKIHVRTHTGDYNYKCTECPARFITKSNLSKHIQRHKGICDYKCEVCQKGYYTKRDVERHMQNSHLMVKNHVCEVCGSRFNHRDNLLNHQLKVHKREKIISKGRMPSYLKAEQINLVT